MAPDVDPGVRLVAEVSGDIIGHLPQSAEALQIDTEIVYVESGGASVTYKVEKVRYVAEYMLVGEPGPPSRYTVYGRTDLIVSVVP